MEKQINFIYENKEILKEILHSENIHTHNRVFFSKPDDDYIGIEQGFKEITCKIIFVDHGIWQYHFINIMPNTKKYISASEFLEIIVKRIQNGKNGKDKK
jgi:hypothetical protein